MPAKTVKSPVRAKRGKAEIEKDSPKFRSAPQPTA